MPQPLKQSLEELEHHCSAQGHLDQLEALFDLGDSVWPLDNKRSIWKAEFGKPWSKSWDRQSSHVGSPGLHSEPSSWRCPQPGDNTHGIHQLGLLTGLYKYLGATLILTGKIPVFTETSISPEAQQEFPLRNWKYLSPVKFWPKGISYFPVQAGVKVKKYPGFEISHESLCELDVRKMVQAGILYKQESKHQVSFSGTAYLWEQQDLVSKQIQTGHRPHKPTSGY